MKTTPFGLCLLLASTATPAFALERTFHEELQRAKFNQVLDGKTLELKDCIFEFKGNKVTSHGPVGATVEGTWAATPDGKGVTFTATSDFIDPPPPTEADHSGDGFVFDWTGRACWSDTWTDLWEGGDVLVLSQNNQRMVLERESSGTYFRRTLLVKVMPGSEDLRAFKQVKKAAATRRWWKDKSKDAIRTMALVQAPPAKNPRKVSEIWWVTPAGKKAAASLVDGLSLNYYGSAAGGNAVIKQWTWGGPPYDIILIVGPCTSGACKGM